MKQFMQKNIRSISICFSAAMHSVLAMDKNGVPLGNVITWADNRGKNEATRIKKHSALEKHSIKQPAHRFTQCRRLLKITWMKNKDKETV